RPHDDSLVRLEHRDRGFPLQRLVASVAPGAPGEELVEHAVHGSPQRPHFLKRIPSNDIHRPRPPFLFGLSDRSCSSGSCASPSAAAGPPSPSSKTHVSSSWYCSWTSRSIRTPA